MVYLLQVNLLYLLDGVDFGDLLVEIGMDLFVKLLLVLNIKVRLERVEHLDGVAILVLEVA